MDTRERLEAAKRNELAEMAQQIDRMRIRISAMSATAKGDAASKLSTLHNNMIIIEKQLMELTEGRA